MTKLKEKLTQARLKELLNYDPLTGVFSWLVPKHKCVVGEPCGSPHCKGYVQLRVEGYNYLAHRLAFLYMLGVFPKNGVDHIDGVRNNNAWANLRACNSSENQQNLGGPMSQNLTGFLGVDFIKKRGVYRARIKLNYRQYHIGYFPTAELAHAAYLKAKAKLHTHHERLLKHREF